MIQTSVVEQLKGKTAGPSRQDGGAARVDLLADSEDIRCTMAVAADLGSSAEALDLDSLCIGSVAVHH